MKQFENLQQEDLIIYNQIQNKDLYKIYNFYYCYMIHSYINKGFMTYEWITFPQSEYELYDKNTNEKLFEPPLLNPLIDNLLNKGMYFPFFSDANNKILLGRHRFYGLSQSKKNISQPFLIISMISSLRYIQDQVLSYQIIEPNKMKQLYHSPMAAVRLGLHTISEFLGRYLKESNNYHSNYFSPHPIFQTKEAFADFINNPWEDYEKKYYELESKLL